MGLQRILRRGIAGATLLALAAACSRSSEPLQEHAFPAAAHLSTVLPARAELAVPALLALSVDDLARHLGAPQPIPGSVQAMLEQLPITDTADSTYYFRYRHLSVLASYDAGTRRLTDLLLFGSNEELLMQRAGLSVEAPDYLLLPVFHAHRPTQLLGLRVVPFDPKQLQ